MNVDITKIICSNCLITFLKHNPDKIIDNYFIKYKKNIDIDGNDIDKYFYFICLACKKVVNISTCYICSR